MDKEHRDDQEHSRKKRTRHTWRYVSLVLLILLTALAALLFIDGPPPNAPWMEPQRTPGGGADNPLVTLLREAQSLPTVSVAFAEHSTGENEGETPLSLDRLRELNTTHATVLTLVDKAMASDLRTWRWPAQDPLHVISPAPLFGQALPLSQAFALRGTMYRREHRHVDSIQDAMKQVQYGDALEQAEGTLIEWLVATTCRQSGSTELRRSLVEAGDQANPALLASVQQTLESIRPRVADFHITLQIEYAFAREVTRRSEDKDVSPHLNPHRDQQFLQKWAKTNNMLQLNANLDRPLVEAASVDWVTLAREYRRAETSFYDWRNDWRLFLHPNVAGNILTGSNYPMKFTMVERGITNAILHDLVVVMLAIRRFELEQGRLPATLSELVPAYMKSVPIDPYDGNELRWIPGTMAVYSIGEDLHDDRGRFTHPRPTTRDKDIGMHYWWAPTSVQP